MQMDEKQQDALKKRYDEPRQAIIQNYFNIPIQEGQFPEYPTDFTKEIQKAEPKEDILTDISADQKQIYFGSIIFPVGFEWFEGIIHVVKKEDIL